jgi:hypothetical protein
MPGVEYKITVSGKNALGIEGKKQQFSFQMMSKDKKNGTDNVTRDTQLVLKGPTTTWSKADFFVEAAFDTCDTQIIRPIVTVSKKMIVYCILSFFFAHSGHPGPSPSSTQG